MSIDNLSNYAIINELLEVPDPPISVKSVGAKTNSATETRMRSVNLKPSHPLRNHNIRTSLNNANEQRTSADLFTLEAANHNEKSGFTCQI